MKQKTYKQKRLKKLTTWEWKTLVASWRYFEYRGTISSNRFPIDMVERFFNGKYDEEECKRIASQFAHTDHGIRGEDDWKDDTIHDCDRKEWCKFYRFCQGYCDGFQKVKFNNPKKGEVELEAFKTEFNNRWYPVNMYKERPYDEFYIPNEWIVSIS